MIYPRKSEESIALSIVAQGYKVHPKVFDRVLCIVHDEKDNLYYYGLAPSKYIYSPENAIHSVAGKNVSVSRAYFKIREVFERCPRLRECASGADKVAVDVGAAPGGWSHYLSYVPRLFDLVGPLYLNNNLYTNVTFAYQREVW
jgi:23S rRNA C2498 (ribose-2'-O)-methylase RlmM